jgi:serine/threonine protein kinase
MSSPGVVNITQGSQVVSKTNSYQVEKELGEGGFGSVYLIRDARQQYAMKLTKMWTFMPHERLEYAKRFRQEFEYGSRINSRYLVKSHDFDTLEGNPFLVMDLCSGGNLRDLVGDRLPAEQLDAIAFGILTGLHDLHNEGIIHRDIKPENVLFDTSRTPKLADFGISASIKKRHTIANFMGHAKEVFATGTYSPPEQMDPRRAMKVMGPANDIFAFGAMMYELITCGSLPFGPFEDFIADMMAYEQRKMRENWDMATLKAHAPHPKWINIISRCIRFEPDNRYPTIADILGDLGYMPAATSETSIVRADSIWKLRIQNGEEIGREYHITNLIRNLGKQTLTIGWFNEEDPFTNDLGVSEHFTQYISGYHATLEYRPSDWHWLIRDGQLRQRDGAQGWYPSTNGTLVNGRKLGIEGQLLRANDIISIGDTTLKVIIV